MTLKINKTTFFDYARKAPLGNKLTQEQVDGIEAIFHWCDFYAVTDLRKVANVLAQCFHETGGKMVGVREGFAKTDAKARKVVATRKYGVPDATSNGRAVKDSLGKVLPTTGHVYYGRGPIQITWADNYYRLGLDIGVDLYNNPDLALDIKIGAQIAVYGMLFGRFTGKSLADYFSKDIDDPIGARRIVNGTDKAQLISTYHKAFLDALEAASLSSPQPVDVNPETAKPDEPNLLTDKTLLNGLASVPAAGAVGALTAVDSPWALAAVVVVIICVVLFLTGRLQIVRKAGV